MKEGNNLPVKKIFGIFMSLFYLGLGIILLFTPTLSEIIPQGIFRSIGGGLIIVYSLFRAYRAWKE